jgi:hypothetical protein
MLLLNILYLTSSFWGTNDEEEGMKGSNNIITHLYLCGWNARDPLPFGGEASGGSREEGVWAITSLYLYFKVKTLFCWCKIVV